MSGSKPSLQDAFLNAARKEKTQVTVFLTSGVKLSGNISWFDNFSLLLRRGPQAQLVYKHAISTISPMGPLPSLRENADSEPADLPADSS